MAVSILLVDDHPEFRHILRQILRTESDLDVAAEADDGEAAVELVQQKQPAVVLMDVAMPRLDGLEATKRIKTLQPDTKVLVLTVHSEAVYREKARASGADAFLRKQEVVTKLVPTIRQVIGKGRGEGTG